MNATIAAIFRHPIKGFTPERLERERLDKDRPFPGDRLLAVENGPSGFDPAAPRFIPKQRFAVLANMADVAKVKTRFDPVTYFLSATAPGMCPFGGNLGDAPGRTAFAAWLEAALGVTDGGPLQVLDGRGHRFLDHPRGHVSILNLASLADMEVRLKRPLDPLRLRANVHVAGWPAWIENDWTGRKLALGKARVRVFQPITRCAAPDVNPVTGERDVAFTAEMHRLYGHLLCGLYVQVEEGGVIEAGAPVELLAP